MAKQQTKDYSKTTKINICHAFIVNNIMSGQLIDMMHDPQAYM